MSVDAAYDASQRCLKIRIDGRFDFSQHSAFRSAYEAAKGDVDEYEIDMSETSYLDSSALGMLLLLRDHAGGADAKIAISHCNDDIRKVLTISNFEQLFSIN